MIDPFAFPHELAGYGEMVMVLTWAQPAVQSLLYRIARDAPPLLGRARALHTEPVLSPDASMVATLNLFQGQEDTPTLYLVVCRFPHAPTPFGCPCRLGKLSTWYSCHIEQRDSFESCIWRDGEFMPLGSAAAMFVIRRWQEMDAALHDRRWINDSRLHPVRHQLAVVADLAMQGGDPNQALTQIDRLHEIVSSMDELLRPLAAMRLHARERGLFSIVTDPAYERPPHREE